MTGNQVIQAWKNEDYRSSLSAEQGAMLPDNPAGMIELSDADLSAVSGGATFGGTCECWTFGCCPHPN